MERHRRLTRLLLGLLGFGACARAAGSDDKGPGIAVTRIADAPGDTARYVVRLTPVVLANAPAVASWHVRLLGTDSTKGADSDYAAALVYHNFLMPRTADTLAVALPATLGDSIGPLRVAARGVNAIGPGGWAKTAPWYAKRKGFPPPPPVITVDSSLAILQLLVRPDTIRFTARGQGRQACPFLQFANGVIALAQGAVYHPLCDSLALRVFTAAQRAVSGPQQLCADSGGTYCATGLGRAREWSASLVVVAASGDTARITASYGLDRVPPFQLVALR